METIKKFFSDPSRAETTGLWRRMCAITGRLEGRVAIVTGANSGIGLAVTAELARRGCKVIMACRNKEKARQAKQQLLDDYGKANREGLIKNIASTEMIPSLSPITEELLVFEHLDLANLDSVRNFVESVSSQYKEIDFLVNNAGVMAPEYGETKDGFEMCIGVNYLGHFLLTELLLPLLKKAKSARIVYVASGGHYLGKLCKPDLHLEGKNYGPYVSYNQSKLAGVMYTFELARRLEGTNVVTASVNPGFVSTDIQKGMQSWKDKLFSTLTKPQEVTPWQGAQTIIYALQSPNIESGGYYEDCEPHMPDRTVRNDTERQWLWEKSCELVGLIDA